MSRFIDPTTDFGFKKIFGDEANKDIIMGFITDVLELATPLLDINFKDKEQLPEAEEERSGVYDVYCQDLIGNHFIVEMQKNRIPFVTDRMIYYSTFPIAGQARKGGKHVTYPEPSFEPAFIGEVATMPYGNKAEAVAKKWDFRLSEVYCIAVLGYALKGSTRIEEAQNMLKLLFSQKLGAIPPEIDEAIRGLNDLEQVRRILAQFATINNWQTLRIHLPKLGEGNQT